MNAKLSIEKIGPQRAQQLLESLFEHQRNLRPNYVKRLASEMRSGEWRLSPDCLVIVKGRLANGQHRMQAVVESGIQNPFIVMATEDDDLYRVIDCGLKRTISDALGLDSYGKAIAAASNWVCKYDRGALTTMGSKFNRNSTLTRSDVIDYSINHAEDLRHCSVFCAILYQHRKIIPASIISAVMHIALRKHPKSLVESFVTALFEGSTRDDACWDLRERLIRNASGKARLPHSYLFGLTIKAFRSYANGTRPGVLKMVEGEDFPVL